MRDFDFLTPASLAEASSMLAEHGDDCRVMAGGTALMLAMRQRMVNPTHVISIAGIEALRGISFDPRAGLRIGALERHGDIARSPLVLQHCPVLAEMAAQVANPQVRHQGTIGGNLSYADPSTDPPGCLMALDASIVLNSSRGQRVLAIREFFVDFFLTALEPDELVVEIRVPPLPANGAGRYARFLRTAAEHRPMASVTFFAQREGRRCLSARLAVGASTPIPTRVERAEEFLVSRVVDLDVAAEVARIVAEDIRAISDARGSEEYRRDMVDVIVRRTIAGLFELGESAP